MAAGGCLMWPNLVIADDDPALRRLEDWERWKAAFLTDDGRVVDHLQDDASHSEGQGYGMLLAAWFDDAPSFRRMHDWTAQFLGVRQDPLLAWRWKPHGTPQIADYNNATDGDLFHAWALLRAGARFDTPAYTAKAVEIARFLAASCIRADPRGGGRLLLLPGAEHFVSGDHVVVNPSYYMPLGLRELGLAAGVPKLLGCADDGERLLAELAVAGLVPDWIEISSSGWRVAPGRVAQSGYDALRSALFLIWSGRFDHPVVRRTAMLYRAAEEFDTLTPTVADTEGRVVLASSDLPGYVAIASLVLCASRTGQHRHIPRFSVEQPYFPAVLHLFSLIASQTAGLAHCGAARPP
jgi:endoglucanase